MNQSGESNPLGSTTTISPSKQYMANRVDLKNFKTNNTYNGYSWYDHGQTNDYLGKVENYKHNLDSLSTGPLGTYINHDQAGEFIATPKTTSYVTPYKAHVVRPIDALKADDLELYK